MLTIPICTLDACHDASSSYPSRFAGLRMRQQFVRLHRWFGVAIALFLFVAG
ncbi:MAG: Uncharacterized iron-regulated membrane protein; Iron-uptake factor PiuB [uncultured Paraburkholderia sp.]|nr:MAG: Uncharacterized iron-regulated membrane protein; Iron-uptake factor PiuB [uncultured Paraburkholderia sp.]CAH2938415.1 MAG: Uncharacterized iron-regulated membrane protein; Iron-uptake factor PiuB [uncultured Paraburkholderia sp.]